MRKGAGRPRERTKKMNIYLIAFLCACGAMSLIAFICYGSDKGRARRGEWRIPEKVLLGLSFFGGSVGGLLGMNAFRHKTKHWYFWAVNLAGLVWQAVAAYFLCAL